MKTTDANGTYIQVAVAAPVAELFDYLPPYPAGDIAILPGMRVLVPFGRGRRIGMVTAISTTTSLAVDRLKRIETLLDPYPLLSAEDLRFVLWAASYYRSSPAEALFSALPARLRRPEALLHNAPPGWRVAAVPAAYEQRQHIQQRAPRQAAILALLDAHPKGMNDAALRQHLGNCGAALRALAEKGLIERCHIDNHSTNTAAESSADKSYPSIQSLELNPDQQAAVCAVRETTGFGCFLLDGVTGSGKTEVYLRLIGDALRLGQQVLVLVPEIGLTPQLYDRFAQRIDVPMAVLHSSLSKRERELAWQQASSGRARLALGTRSAVFTPLPDLGLIIVDEEHDLSLKQQEGFRYSARDLAVRRAQVTACPVLLGSATPSLESLHNARLGRYRPLRLPQRAGAAIAPRILIADIRSQPLETGLCHALLTRMEQEISAGNQVLLFLNRRGFSPVLTCHDCGWISECQQCDARMTLHLERDQLLCHHCGLMLVRPARCPYCESPDLRPLGQGTERVEDSLRQRFPGIPLARIDRDSTRRKGELERLLAAAERAEFRILLGTQMLAKGHHFPGITLVGILDLDQGLYGSDFRATERMAQLLLQVAGRAGRAERAGTVLLQTRHPRHPLLTRLLHDGYGAFADDALAERAEARLPPFSHQALLRADSPKPEEALSFLRQALATAQPLAPPSVELWGPVSYTHL